MTRHVTPAGKYALEWSLLISLVFGIAGVLYIQKLTSPFGMHLSNDGLHYLAASDNLNKGNGFTYINPDGEPEFAGHWAPGYSMAVAVVIKTSGLSAMNASRLVNFTCIILTFLLFNLILYDLGLHVAIILLCNVLLFLSHTTIRFLISSSEALFIPFVLFTTYFMLKWLRTFRSEWLMWGAIVCACNVLVRYAGLGVAAGFALGILYFTRDGLKNKLWTCIQFLAPTAGIYVLWTIYTYFASNGGYHRGIGFHPPATKHLEQLTWSITSWVNPANIAFITLPILLFLAFVSGYMLYKVRWKIPDNKQAIIFLILLTAGYFFFLLFSITVFDFNTPLDLRILAPAFPVTAIIAGLLMQEALNTRPWVQIVTALVILTVLTSYGLQWKQLGDAIYRDGFRFTEFRWRTSETISFAKEQLPGRTLYSNNYAILRYYLGYTGDIRQVPYEIKEHRFIEIDRPDFHDVLTSLGNDVRSDSAAVIVFYGKHLRTDMETLERYLQGTEKAELGDGFIVY